MSNEIPESFKSSTNIIYITTDCNLDCDYCYQREDRNNLKKQIVVSEEEIDNFLLNLVKTEPKIQSRVVVFGGEPFLAAEKIFYLLEKAEKITKDTNKTFSFCVNTNGIWFLNDSNRKRFFEAKQNLSNSITIEVSYDGSFSKYRRLTKKGKSTRDDIKKLLKLFKEENRIFHLRYTIHKETLKTFKKDMIHLSNFLTYNPNNRIVISHFDKEIEPIIGMLTSEYINEIKPFLNDVFKKYKIPLCQMVCEECQLCDFAKVSDKKIYTIPKSEKEYIENDNADKFEQFTKFTKGK